MESGAGVRPFTGPSKNPLGSAESLRVTTYGLLGFPSSSDPVLATAPVPIAPPKEYQSMNGTTLTTAEYKSAQNLFAQMAAPISAEERAICEQLGLSEAAYLEERNRLLGAKLPGAHASGLTSEELHVTRLLNVTPETFCAAKTR